jgi:DNA-binding transcriptional regulator YdaS (Cro superfamily)
MSATSVKLLQAAAEVVGGTKVLASHLGISEALLSRFMADRRELPDALLLRAMDIILEDVESRRAPPAESPQDALSAPPS